MRQLCSKCECYLWTKHKCLYDLNTESDIEITEDSCDGFEKAGCESSTDWYEEQLING